MSPSTKLKLTEAYLMAVTIGVGILAVPVEYKHPSFHVQVYLFIFWLILFLPVAWYGPIDNSEYEDRSTAVDDDLRETGSGGV
jgi:hypothetical protein